MTLKPFGDRLLVKPDPQKTQIGLIHIPEMVNADNPNYFTMTGVVVDKGAGAYDEELGEIAPIEAEIGERVLFGRFAGKQVQHEGSIHLLMRAPEVLMLVEGDHAVRPGYQAAEWRRAKRSAGDTR